jgi:hypothetical protein
VTGRRRGRARGGRPRANQSQPTKPACLGAPGRCVPAAPSSSAPGGGAARLATPGRRQGEGRAHEPSTRC